MRADKIETIFLHPDSALKISYGATNVFVRAPSYPEGELYVEVFYEGLSVLDAFWYVSASELQKVAGDSVKWIGSVPVQAELFGSLRIQTNFATVEITEEGEYSGVNIDLISNTKTYRICVSDEGEIIETDDPS